MTAAESDALDLVYRLERGWYAGGNARDPNPTLDGVIQKTYNRWRDDRGQPRRSVREMTAEERVAIYREFYRVSHAGALPPAIGAVHFAFAFNSGPADAARALQKAVGAVADGVIGPKTLAAVAAADPTQLLPVLLVEQAISYYDEAIAHQRLRPNMTSWIGRLATAWHRYGAPVEDA